MEPSRLNTVEVAGILNVSPERIRQWRVRDCGPPYHRNGRSVYYLKREVRHWCNVCGEPFIYETHSVAATRSYSTRLCEGFAMLDDCDP